MIHRSSYINIILFIGLLAGLNLSCGNKGLQKFTVEVSDNEYWWIGITALGHLMPLNDSFSADMRGNGYGNQIQPLVLSTTGKVIWCDSPIRVQSNNGKIIIESDNSPIEFTQAGKTLKDAYQYASQTYFPTTKQLPHTKLFVSPQYNTWIELMYNQNQQDILAYAHAIIDNGFPPGVLMIDDNWQEDYGKWTFHPGRFPDPKTMVDELHELGFLVMVWVCPFVSPDSDVYRELAAQGAFLITEEKLEANSTLPAVDFRGNPMPEMVNWWNGNSAVLDLSNPLAMSWFKDQLNNLQTVYDIDGFKFDAGDPEFYTTGLSFSGATANTQVELFGKVGLDYPLNEYRAMWKMGGQPLVQRLRDKNHNWEDLQTLVPSMLLGGLMGYYYNCPDMIGGGDFTSFIGGAAIDQELIVRSAQCHALMPMMQFSVAPWRILDEQHFEAVKKAVKLRNKFSDYILEEAKKTSISGEPIMRPISYDYPNNEHASISNQFFIGENLMVAPVVEKNTTEKEIVVPEGKWMYQDKKIVKGPAVITVSIGLTDLPYFTKLN